MSNVADSMAMIAESPVMIGLWRKYSKKYTYAAAVTWDMAIGALKILDDIAEGMDEPMEMGK
jgi:hypothetical protein